MRLLDPLYLWLSTQSTKANWMRAKCFLVYWDLAGSTPVSTTLFNDRVVQRLRHLNDTQETEGSIPSAITDRVEV